MTRFLTAAAFAAPFALLAFPAAAQDTPAALGDAFCDAVVAEDAAALAALYTDNADSYGPDGVNVTGPAAIEANWAMFFEGFNDFTCALEQKGEMSGKNMHAAWGMWSMTATPAEGGEAMTMTGSYSDFSIKSKQGWRYRMDHASNSAPSGDMAVQDDKMMDDAEQ